MFSPVSKPYTLFIKTKYISLNGTDTVIYQNWSITNSIILRTFRNILEKLKISQ